ncbi:hypothetical protein ABLA30_03880 [Xenorhabdus nematophila]|uniref:hypothetical protein n=1 Tax=Xenorhabdus nematophila TaxID=628 RepID=UPI0032B851D5
MDTFNGVNTSYSIDNIIIIAITEDVFNQICTVGNEFIWFPKIESSAGRSMIIDLEAARNIRGDFDFISFRNIIKVGTELQDNHLFKLNFLYLVDTQ